MRRRDVLLGGAAAASALAAPPALAARPSADLARRIDERLERLGARMAPFTGISPGLDGTPDSALFGHLGAAARALTAYGTVHGLDESEVADPAVQERLNVACVEIARSMRSVASHLEGLTADRVSALHAGLFERSDAARTTLATIRAEVASMGIAPKVRKQLENTLDRVAFRMERQGTGAVLDDVLERYRRAEERALARQATRQARGDPDDLDDLPMRSPDEDKADRALGIILLGLGLTTGGMLVAGIGASSGFLLVCICVSVPMLIATILLLVSAGRVLGGGK